MGTGSGDASVEGDGGEVLVQRDGGGVAGGGGGS